VTVTDDNGCMDMATATVTVNPNPVAAVGDVTVCEGEPATLTATGGTTYLWETGETSESITLDPAVAGTYTVSVTNDNGCSADAEGTITVNLPPVVDISATSNNEEICEGESVTITASGADTYLWNNGETTPIVEESEFGIGYAKYYVLAYGPDDVIVEYQLATDVDPLPKFQVSTSPDGLYSIHTFIAITDVTIFDAVSYLDEAIVNSGTIDDLYMITIEGGGDLCMKIDREGVQTELKMCRFGLPVDDFAFEVYPNPAKETIYFKNVSLDSLTTIELSNVEGKVLHQFNIGDNSKLVSLSVKDYPTGIYLLKATTALKTYTTKVVIQ